MANTPHEFQVAAEDGRHGTTFQAPEVADERSAAEVFERSGLINSLGRHRGRRAPSGRRYPISQIGPRQRR
jgi:hypothetical protein